VRGERKSESAWIVPFRMKARASSNGHRNDSAQVAVGVAVAERALLIEIIGALEDAHLHVAAAGTEVAELSERCDGQAVDVVIIALEPGGEQRPSDVDGLRDWAPNARIVVVAPSGGGRSTRKALAHGADGFVVRDVLPRTLAPTVHAVAAGQLCLPREDRQGLNRQPLSYRERQTLGMVVMGYSNGEIANRLYLAESTVKSHLSSAFRKLGVRSRSEAAALVLDPNEGVGVGILTIPTSDGRHRVAAGAKGG
jgi:DNA-binding NarL/FixJ family response regulator